MKSKIIMTVSIVVGFAISFVLISAFESIGLDTRSYNSSTEETEGNYLLFYCMFLWVLLGMRTHWLLTGKTEENSEIELRTGWWYWLVGSTVCAIAIYLVELIGIQYSGIEWMLESAIGLIIAFYFHQHFESKIKRIKFLFDWIDVSVFFDWEGRPAVTVIPSDGLLEGWFMSGPGVWERASPLEIRDSGRELSMKSFQECFEDSLNLNDRRGLYEYEIKKG